jgi:alkanesulfonate monooxygenase SsuD/methylene tetrahydromethanopterin reductase-like flavin-dependent oxidoreductase (luciferase family)
MEGNMKFGAFISGASYAEMIETAQFAERAGFDGVFFPQTHQPVRSPGGAYPPQQPGATLLACTFLVCAAVAARTERVQVGTALRILTISHPVQIAQEAAALDIISGGRFILGAGIGYQPQDFAAYGIPMANRLSLFDEGLEIVRRCWIEESFSFVGKRFTLRNVAIAPKPLQKPHPPLWVGPWSLEGAKRAARQATGILTDPFSSNAAQERMVTTYRSLAKDRGVAPYVACMREIMIAESREEALNVYGESAVRTYRGLWGNKGINPELEPWVRSVTSAEQVTLEALKPDERFLIGSPRDVIRQIERLDQDLGGMGYMIPLFISPPKDGYQTRTAAMKLFSEKVIPHFR